jgi:hypothetical protein
MLHINTVQTVFFVTPNLKPVFACATRAVIPRLLALICGLLMAQSAWAQSIRLPWSGYAHDPQHDAIAPVASQPLNRILWHTPVDLKPRERTADSLRLAPDHACQHGHRAGKDRRLGRVRG